MNSYQGRGALSWEMCMVATTLPPCRLGDYRSVSGLDDIDHRCCDCWKSLRLGRSAHVSPNDGKQVSRFSCPLALTANSPNCYTVLFADEHLAEARMLHRHRICDRTVDRRARHTYTCLPEWSTSATTNRGCRRSRGAYTNGSMRGCG